MSSYDECKKQFKKYVNKQYGLSAAPMTGYVPRSLFFINSDPNVSPWAPTAGAYLPEVVDVKVFNERAVEVVFKDGTKARAVCDKNDVFDLEKGITICLLKRVLSATDGTKRYNKAVRQALKVMDNKKKALQEKAVKEAAEATIKEHQAAKRARYKAKRRARKAAELAKALKEAEE